MFAHFREQHQEYDTGEKTLLQLLHKGKLKTKFCIFVDYSY